MLRGRRRVRPDERRQTWAAFLLLFGLIFGHAVLETARDALFLASIPPTRLPFVYIGIAGVSLGIAQAQARYAAGLNRKRALSIWIGSAALVTFVFWLGLERLGQGGLYGLYIWSGVLTTLVLVHFWTLLGGIFSVTQAKRLYSFIGTGSVLGAIVGSAGASAISTYLDARHLLLVSAVAFAGTSVVPSLFPTGDDHEPDEKKSKDGLLESAAFVVRHPYALRVAMFVVVSTMALTLGDYVFKATVVDLVPAADLGRFFGATYLALNALSLVSQVAVVSYVIRRFDLVTALSILPVLILIGAVGFVALPGLAAALVIKGADGSLKHSVHRTSTELMFVPFTDRSRARVKAFIDVVGQRGGQTVASLVVLGFAATELELSWLAMALALVTAFWVAGAIDIRRHYVDVFRSRVGGPGDAEAFPDLDVASLETLVATLDSPNEAEVLAAMRVLVREGRTRVIPGVILYHPSEDVVVRSLEVFVSDGRTRVLPAVDRLLEHESSRVRTAAVAARAHLGPNERILRMRLSLDDSPEVRAAIMINLIAMGAIVGSDADDVIDNFIAHGTVDARVALAEAIHRRADPKLAKTLVALAHADEAEVQCAAAAAMAMAPHETFIETLILMVGRSLTAQAAKKTLLGYGDVAFERLVEAIATPSIPVSTRRAIPKVLGAFGRDDLSETLLDIALTNADGPVRYSAILGLESLVSRDPSLVLDESRLVGAVEDTLARAYRYLDRRVALAAGAKAAETRVTPGHGLLQKALNDKQAHAMERAFRLLGLLHPLERFANIRRDALGDDSGARQNAIELLDNLLRPPLRGEVIALIDEAPDDERRTAGARLHRPERLDYEALLEDLLSEESGAIQDMTAFHIGELRLARFEAHLRSLEPSEGGDIDRTLAILDGLSEEKVDHAR